MGSFMWRIAVVLGLLAMSFLPATGTAEGHYAVASGVMRLVAVLYAVVIALRLSSPAQRLADASFVILLAALAWTETYPAGNHVRETAVYAAMTMFVAI